MKIENFPLRIFITYSSLIGFTFSELKWKNWPHLIKCVSMIMIHLYVCTLFTDHKKAKGMHAKELTRNHFGTMMDLAFENFFQLAFICSYIFYYINGHLLIRSSYWIYLDYDAKRILSKLFNQIRQYYQSITLLYFVLIIQTA
uniref:Uncharacterized protein LOC113791099 n=1 Tax=Dermatophagoides pteronyssinus TaxID=6956 RepID=A0A6P6XUI3_DERPT|nr:uncharacterized protein LOC113791099 [Dermatophagoides pteronyssinus]